MMYDERFDMLTTPVSQVVWAVARIREGGGGGVKQYDLLLLLLYRGYIKKARFFDRFE